MTGTAAEAAIDKLISGEWEDPETGKRLGVPVDRVVIGDNLVAHAPELLRPLFETRALAVVCDPQTREAAGEEIAGRLDAAGIRVEPIMLADYPEPSDQLAARIGAAASACDAIVAVGSGTINDLCKLAAHVVDKPYAVFGTAASMNGYASANASVTVEGFKTTVPPRAPRGIFLDTGVLAAAPPRLSAAGLADSLCRTTAQADWLLANRVFNTPYMSAPFALLALEEDALVAEAGALARGDAGAHARLARTLVLSGFGMTLAGSSAPASQGEHLIAHYLDMMGHVPGALHGEQIAVTTLSMAALQDVMLAGRPPRLGPSPVNESDLARHYGAHAGMVSRALQAKALSPQLRERANAVLSEDWEQIVGEIRSIRRPLAELHAALQAAGAPVHARDLGLDPGIYAGAVKRARQIRDRYTFLDLAYDTGTLEPFLLEQLL